VLAVVIILFFIHPFVHAINLSLPWIALTGAMALLVRPTHQEPFFFRFGAPPLVLTRGCCCVYFCIVQVLSGIHEIQEIIEKVEMATLLFFAGLFVLMR
jgi:Na+/H+ antiporter NhaD/arsenite permease-like protein